MAVHDALTLLGSFVTSARDGLHGLEIAKTNPFSYIILDRMLPGLEGSRSAPQSESAG